MRRPLVRTSVHDPRPQPLIRRPRLYLFECARGALDCLRPAPCSSGLGGVPAGAPPRSEIVAAVQLRVAFVGEEGAGLRTLQLLAKGGHRVVAAFSDSEGDGAVASVEALAGSLAIPLHPASAVREPATADWLRERDVHLLLNVHSLHIVDPSLLDVPTLGAYNLHPGPLPECAGLNAPSWALYEGSQRHGVTLHRMVADIDAGTIAFSDAFDVGAGDTGLSVMTQCIQRGLGLIERLLALAASGEPIPARAQDLDKRRWFDAGPPDGGRLDWDRPSRQVVDFVRACDYRPFASPWGAPRCALDGRQVGVLAAHTTGQPAGSLAGTVGEADGDGAVLVASSDEWVRVEEIELDGQAISAGEVLRDGLRLTSAG
jgi:methionyl-tRNA formyltransferase